nr:hypothetical protein [Tanacetum cinerariifolium]
LEKQPNELTDSSIYKESSYTTSGTQNVSSNLGNDYNITENEHSVSGNENSRFGNKSSKSGISSSTSGNDTIANDAKIRPTYDTDSLELCQEQVKNDKVCKQNQSTVFLKERGQYFKIQDLKAQLQEKNIAINELKKLNEKMKGKGVDTNFKQPPILGKLPLQIIRNQPVERIQMLMQGTSLTKQERKCKLYDEFDKFAYRKGESLRDFYLRFSLLLNDMNIYNMKLEQFQVNTKFLNTLPLEWSKFVTDVKLAQPIEKHVHAVKRIFRYLLESLIFSVALTAFADADHAGCQDTRRNTSGSVQFLRERLISWSSKKQKSVAISSTKADTSPYLDVVHKFYGCDHNFRTMALDSTKFQCTAIIKVILPYAAIMSNTLGLSISTSDTTLSRSRNIQTKLLILLPLRLLGVTITLLFKVEDPIIKEQQVVSELGSASEGTATKKGRTIAVTTEDIQKRRNDVKARTTLLLALPDEHQLRFSKYKTAQELWAAILKTFSGNEATKKTKKNLLKQHYGNFKVEGSETLEQTFNRLHVIVSQLEFMDIEIEQDDLNQKFLTSLTPEWLMHIIVWRNRSDLDTMSLDDLYNHLKVYELEVQKKSESNSQNMAFISTAKNSSGNGEVNTADIPTASTQVSPAGSNVATASISLDTACAYIASQSNESQIKYEDINQIDEDDIKEMDIKAPRSQDRGRRDNYRQGSNVEEQAPKALMVIDKVGWDWSFMANEKENHALVADEEAPTEFTLMAKTNAESEVFDNSLCFKACKQNTDSLNSKIIKLSEKLGDRENILYHYKLGLSQVEARLVEFKNQEVKFCEKIRGLELKRVRDPTRIRRGQDTVLFPPPAQVYSPPKKDTSWTGLPEFADDTITDYSMPSPAIESTSDDLQNKNPSVKKGRACLKNNYTHKSMPPKTAMHKPNRSPMRPTRPNMNAAQSKWTSCYKPAYSYVKRPFQRRSAVGTTFQAPRVPIINRKFPTVNKKIPTVNRKFPTGNTKTSIADLGNKGKAGNSQNYIDDKGYWDSGCSRHMTGNISYLSDYEPFDGGYVSFGQGGCKITGKGTIKTDKCMLWHRRLGHLNIKTMNRLVRHNLVRGLPSKCFDNDHTCVACLKGKQHKASCKTKLVNSVTKPIHTLHMDLFGPTSVSSINHKWYCLVVTDDFCRFTWTFFLKTKDKTSGILRNFITEIENLKDLKLKIIRFDNEGEFRNKKMNDFCSRKRIKREFSNARTPQQNGVAEMRNKTLIEAARTILADAKLPVTFWAEVVNTYCYVQNKVLVNKSQNKTPYELFNCRTTAIGFLKPFGYHVIILNTLDHLGKFDAKGDEGYFIGYSMSSKAFMVFNKRTKRVEENLHVDFLENKAIEKGVGPNWLFDIDSLTNSMNYVPVVVTRTNSTNFSAHLESSTSNAQDTCNVDAPESSGNSNPTATSTNPPTDHMETLAVETPVPTVSSPVPTACFDDSPQLSSDSRLISKRVTSQDDTPSLDNILNLTNRFEDILRVTTNSDESNGVEADVSNMETTITASPTPTFRIHKDHPKKPKKIFDALNDPSWVEAMQEELLQFKIQNVWSLVDCPKGVRPIRIKWVLKNKKDERGIVIRNKARLVATSTTEAEYVAAASGCGQVLWIQNQLLDYGHHFIKDCFEKKLISVDHIHTDDNVADLLTKPFDVGRFQYLVVEHAIRGSVSGNYIIYIAIFWSTARIETTDEGTKILATIDGQFSHQWKYLIHTIMQCLSPKSTGFNEFSRNIATALVCLATNKVYNFSKIIFDSMVRNVNNNVSKFLMYPRQYTRRARIAQSLALPPVADEPASSIGADSQGEACPTDSGLKAEQDRANITKTSTLPSDSTPRDEMASKITAQDLEIYQLKVRVKLLEDRDGGGNAQCGKDAPIKGRSFDKREEATIEKGSNDTEEMVNVLTSLDATTILSSGASVSISSVTEVPVAEVPTGSGSIPTASLPVTGVPTGGVPTGSDVVPTASLIFTTATVATSYTRRKGKEKMVESETPKKKSYKNKDAEIARIHAKEELQIMIDGLDRNNETVAKYLQEYYQFAVDLPIGERIELISNLVKYQDNYEKVLKYQIQQRKPSQGSNKKSFICQCSRITQIQDFIPIGSKEESERFKRKGIRLEQHNAKKVKTSEEVPEENLKEMMQLIPVEEIIRLRGSSASYQFFVDLLKHFDREDLNQLWALVKETLNIRQATNDKEKELWVELKRLYEPDVEDQLWTHTQNLMHAPVEWKLYDTCGVHHVSSKDQEMFMLAEKDYPLRKGSGDKEVPTASEESSPLVKRKDATAERIALLMKTGVCHGQRHIYNIQRRVTVTQTPCPIKGVLRTMDTIIDQQVARDEALVPHAKRLRIGRSNFRLLSDIKSKESTLQLVYDVLRLWNTKKSNEMYYPRFTKVIIHYFMSKDPSISRRNKVNWNYVRDDHMFSTIKLVSKHQNTQQFGALLPIELTNEDIKNSNAYKEYYAVATGATPPKPKASVWKTKSSFDTTITHPSAAAGPRLTTSEKGKQAAKASKAKSLSALSEVAMTEEELSWSSTDEEGDDDEGKDGDGDEEDDGDDGEEGDGDNDDEDDDGEEGDDDDDQEVERDDEEEGGDDEQESDEEEFIHPNTDDEVNGEKNIGLNVGREEAHDEEEEEDELYKDVNINQGRGIQMTQEVKDSHVTLTLVNPDGQQHSSSVSSQFVTSMLNLTLDVVKVSDQIQSDRLHNEAKKENDEFLKTIDENKQKTIKEQVKEQVKISYVVATDLSEMELKKILIEKMEGNKSIHRSNEHSNLYKALVEAYKSDKIILDTYGDTVTLKRRRDDDADKDEEPFAGPERGSKRRREGKEPDESATAEEPMQTTFQIEEPSHPEFDTGAEYQPIVQSSQHPEWFSQQQKPPTPDRDWNKTLPATYGSIQPWISELVKQSDSRFSFNKLMDTPLDFSNFLINRLKVDTLTPKFIAGPTYELLKGSCKSLTKATDYGHIKWIEDLVPRTMWIEEPIGYDKHALWRRRIIAVTELKILEWHNYKHLDWIMVRRDDDKLYKFKEGDFKRLRIQDIEDISIVIQRRVEDLQLGVESYQKKLNLTKLDTYRSDLKRKEAYIAYSNPRGFIYQNKDNKNRLMWIDELHKFNDGTLTDVRTALDDRLKGIQMKYLPQSIWRKRDKDRAAAMIRAIIKRLKTRRIMRSLERFVGGRLYEGDFRMLQRTI